MDNPKNKAYQLIEKFYQTTPNEAWINEPLGISEKYNNWKQSKECALITVDEIISASPSLPILGDGGTFGEDIELSKNYWLEVKKEIENYGN